MKNNKISNLICAVLLFSVALLSTGCGTGDGSTTTDFLNGVGYNISLTVPKTVNPGGSALIRVEVKDPAGFPVPDATKVIFSASKGDLEPKEAETINGIAATTYTAPKDENEENPSAPEIVKISAFCQGALAWSSNITIPYGF